MSGPSPLTEGPGDMASLLWPVPAPLKAAPELTSPQAQARCHDGLYVPRTFLGSGAPQLFGNPGHHMPSALPFPWGLSGTAPGEGR